MRLSFHNHTSETELRQPAPCCFPQLKTAEIAALYRGARVGGDFFEFVCAGHDRVLLLLLDIAGRRDQALHLAATVQDVFRAEVPELFHDELVNEADAITQLAITLNHTLLDAASGVHCAPGFIACYNESMGSVAYINAGHLPALVRNGGITQLDASGLPLGLFSHATHDAQLVVLEPGSVLLLASKGLVELRFGRKEFGLERLKQTLLEAPHGSAAAVCQSVLDQARSFSERKPRLNFFGLGNNHENGDADPANDLTTVALLRK
jgi:serine phosphatase RsbU (regulator of sigma subunit)